LSFINIFFYKNLYHMFEMTIYYILDDIYGNFLLVVGVAEGLCFVMGACPSQPYYCSQECKARGYPLGGSCSRGTAACCCTPQI
jgi:hypothetical protein